MLNSTTEEESRTSAQREWFDEAYFKDNIRSKKRWATSGLHFVGIKVHLNPRFPDTIEKFQNNFPLLKALADSYTTIDALSKKDAVDCVDFMDAFEYILNFNEAPEMTPNGYGKIETISIWRDYMSYMQQKIDFAPDFSQWDKYTREFENAAISAIKESDRVTDEYNMELEAEIEKGIYVRLRVLKKWIKTYLEPIRARDDYKRWKEEKESMASLPSQPRRRKNRQIEAASATGAVHQLPDTVNHRHMKTIVPLRKLFFNIQDDLTIWILSLTIYFSCAIIQAISFSRATSSPPSSSDYLNSLQTTLTQVFSVYTTYTLSDRAMINKAPGIRFRVWVISAAILPIVAMVVLRWSISMSVLLDFVGTVANGFLQVTLAVHIKETKLP